MKDDNYFPGAHHNAFYSLKTGNIIEILDKDIVSIEKIKLLWLFLY